MAASTGAFCSLRPSNSGLTLHSLGSSSRVLLLQRSLAQFSDANELASSRHCGLMDTRLAWITCHLPESSLLCRTGRTIPSGGQSFRAHVCTVCAQSEHCHTMQGRCPWKSSVARLRRNQESVIARATFNVAYEFEDAFSAFALPQAPDPVLYPRKMLNLKFAVLLMRSAYEAVDALDFIPMDKFQVKFWKLRQSELEPYTLQCRPLRVKYGDLTDPLYFDFISFSQFAAISNEIKTGELVFQEKIGSDGESRTVRRDERLKDNAALPAAFVNKAGDLLYGKLVDGFEGENFNAPPPASSDFLAVTDGVKKLVQVFVDKGYALKASVEPVQFSPNSTGGKLRVKLEGSATQWGLRALASRRALLVNDFTGLAVGAYLRACGFSAYEKIRYSDTSTEQLWTIV
ncbi:uncharacterized protein [Physcomitrium patens]|uniref:Uncharacterized protein n=1 Tax=Physcomitrium patens TaxID=3218 RepID=A0A2K1IX90_PHYPA|nr:uncharacterized protein LOC112295749 [Physcomitrium patens]PNR33897.1 hypothetical protein PHYPA_023713 [Physcomitrium patens]|eukprot:XP_024403433.1 uncharacterized protein LOC112295749 [Physcomitrella patens]